MNQQALRLRQTYLIRRFLLLALGMSFLLPMAVNADYEEQVFKRRWPIFVDNFVYGTDFHKAKDYEMMCERFVQANNDLKTYFTIFQKYKRPDSKIDLFQTRAELKPIVKSCGEVYGIY